MALRDPAPQPVPPEAAPDAGTATMGDTAGDMTGNATGTATAHVAGQAADSLTAGQESTDRSGLAANALVPVRRPASRPAQRPMPARSGLIRAPRWRRQAQLAPLGTTLRRVARHPAVVGSASAATVLAARVGVEVLRSALARERQSQSAGRLFVRRRVVVEYVETWSGRASR